MMFSFTFIFLCSTYLITYTSCGVVSFIDPCAPDDQACILASAAKAIPYIAAGLPELGVLSADPLIIKEVQALDGDLKLSLHDIKVEGLRNCKIINIERNTDQNTVKLVADCPFVTTGTYKGSGKVLFVPVEGNGPFTIRSENIKIKITIKLDTVDIDGKKHWRIIRRNLDFEPVEKVFLNFENLFNGDKEKAEPVQKLFDQGWLELVTTLGKPIFEEVINKAVDIVGTFLDKVPMNELEKV